MLPLVVGAGLWVLWTYNSHHCTQDPLEAKAHRRAQGIQSRTLWQVAAMTWPRRLDSLSFRELLPRRSPSLQHREHVVLAIVTLQAPTPSDARARVRLGDSEGVWLCMVRLWMLCNVELLYYFSSWTRMLFVVFEHYGLWCMFLFWLYCTYHLVPWILSMSICYVCGFHNVRETRESLAIFFVI